MWRICASTTSAGAASGRIRWDSVMRHGSRYNGATVYDGMKHDTPMHLSSAEAYWCYSAILSI